MSIHGIAQNAKWDTLVLTETKSQTTVDGQSLVPADSQRWVGEVTYDDTIPVYSVALKNKGSGDYLAWDTNMKVVMNVNKYWWRLVVVGRNVGFQVPVKESASDSEASVNATGYYTLELKEDRSIVLKFQEADLIQAQLWTIIDK